MKKYILSLFILLTSCDSYAQHKVYCELISQQQLNTKMGFVRADFGKEYKKNEIKDAEGEKIKFKSIVDALNYMSELGWVLDFTYVVSAEEVHCVLSIELPEETTLPELFKKKAIRMSEEN